MNVFNIKVHDSWIKFLKTSKFFDEMLDFINNTENISPKKELVFRFFECNLYNAKCIILGMDPYPSDVATGRAFEVNNVKKWTDKYKQTSLSKIFKTLYYIKSGEIIDISSIREKVNESNFKYIYVKEWFDEMEKEGVIFLNATLTTILGKSNAHTDIWKGFMDELLIYITSVNNNIRWLVWGTNALKRIKDIVSPNNIIYSCHPATRTNNDFVETACFTKVKGINWV